MTLLQNTTQDKYNTHSIPPPHTYTECRTIPHPKPEHAIYSTYQHCITTFHHNDTQHTRTHTHLNTHISTHRRDPDIIPEWE